MIAIVNTNFGNLTSVLNALRMLGYQASIVDKPSELQEATHVVLPGVGAFNEGMTHLENGGWMPELQHQIIEKRKPFLGICLGMQLMATLGFEFGRRDGLGWIDGEVRRLQVLGLRLPHVGWNEVLPTRNSRLLSGFQINPVFYFVHSFCFHPRNELEAVGLCNYGESFVAAVEKDNLAGTQFHPEKSQNDGLKVLKNFVEKFH